MRVRNWLLTGTSLALLLSTPMSLVHAQDVNPAVTKAFEAYQANQTDETKQALLDACTAAGFAGLDDCVAALSGQAPADKPSSAAPEAPAPSSEAAPSPAP